MIRSVSSKVLFALGGIVEVGCVIHVFAEYIAEPTLVSWLKSCSLHLDIFPVDTLNFVC